MPGKPEVTYFTSKHVIFAYVGTLKGSQILCVLQMQRLPLVGRRRKTQKRLFLISSLVFTISQPLVGRGLKALMSVALEADSGDALCRVTAQGAGHVACAQALHGRSRWRPGLRLPILLATLV